MRTFWLAAAVFTGSSKSRWLEWWRPGRGMHEPWTPWSSPQHVRGHFLPPPVHPWWPTVATRITFDMKSVRIKSTRGPMGVWYVRWVHHVSQFRILLTPECRCAVAMRVDTPADKSLLTRSEVESYLRPATAVPLHSLRWAGIGRTRQVYSMESW